MNGRILLHDGNIKYLFASSRNIDVECVTHLHCGMEIVIVTKGQLFMEIGGEPYRISEGFGAFIPPLETHMFHSEVHNQCQVLMFSKELVMYFYDFIKDKFPQNHMFELSRESRALADRILPEKTDSGDYIQAQAVLAPLLYEICQNCDFVPRKTSLEDAVFVAAEYMNQHFVEDISLSSVAKAVGIHPVTLSKKFAEQTRTNFNMYLSFLRCSRAAVLIKSYDLTFAEVAYSSGFSSIRSFNRAFLSIFDMTPTQFKNSTAI